MRQVLGLRGRRRGYAAVLSAFVFLVLAPILGPIPSAAAATLTPPDMQMVVPTNMISIGINPANGHRQLQFTHITADKGVGPFEIDPTYNPTTGTATFQQAIYNSPSPGMWQL